MSQRGTLYHVVSWPVYNWEELAGRGKSLLKDSLDISQHMVSDCIVYHLPFFEVYFSLFLLYYFSLLFLLLLLYVSR